MQSVEFSKLPDFNNLFLDYISDSFEDNERVLGFFNSNFRTNEDFFKVIDKKIHNYNTQRYFDKSQLIEIIKRQNVEFGGDEKTAENIELLRQEDTFAVVTGQQTTLYTGPLYTVLKTITAVKLAHNLKERFPQFNFVPVFWLESEDHDFAEAAKVYVINRENELVTIGYDGAEQDDNDRKNLKPVGSMQLGEVINSLNLQLKSNLIDTQFREKIISDLEKAYNNTADFKTAFAQMMNKLMSKRGVVFIDPSDIEIKNLLTPVFEKELRTFPVLCEKIISASAEIEKNYDLQLKPKVINLFYIHNGNRLLIEPREEGRFALKNSKRRFEAGELEEELRQRPENFSPNVVLRPICQDYLLPTVAYVAGPGEISYFAQLKCAYEHYNLTMPVIFPRISATLIEEKIGKFLRKYDLKLEDIFHEEFLISKVIERMGEINIENEISKFHDEFNKVFYDMKNLTAGIDQTLLKTVDNMKEKIKSNLEIFKSRLINAQAKKSEITTSQIYKVTNNIYPDKKLQERMINITYFLNKYDYAFIERLFSETDILNFNHQVIEI